MAQRSLRGAAPSCETVQVPSTEVRETGCAGPEAMLGLGGLP